MVKAKKLGKMQPSFLLFCIRLLKKTGSLRSFDHSIARQRSSFYTHIFPRPNSDNPFSLCYVEIVRDVNEGSTFERQSHTGGHPFREFLHDEGPQALALSSF